MQRGLGDVGCSLLFVDQEFFRLSIVKSIICWPVGGTSCDVAEAQWVESRDGPSEPESRWEPNLKDCFFAHELMEITAVRVCLYFKLVSNARTFSCHIPKHGFRGSVCAVPAVPH